MAVPIPDSTLDLFERPLLCALSTINPDGQPHIVPVWCDFDGTYVRVNCPAASRKARNMIPGSKVTVLVLDPQDPGHWIEVMGHVSEVMDEAHGARDHINSLSKKYTGNPDYQEAMDSRMQINPEDPAYLEYRSRINNRKLYMIEPDKVHGR